MYIKKKKVIGKYFILFLVFELLVVFISDFILGKEFELEILLYF